MKSSAKNAKPTKLWIEAVSLVLASALLTAGVLVVNMILSWLETQAENWFGLLIFAGWVTILITVRWFVPSSGECMLKLNTKLNPQTTNTLLKIIQVLCIITVFLAAYKAMSLTGPEQISKALVSYLAFVMFLVIDMYRHKKFPWIS